MYHGHKENSYKSMSVDDKHIALVVVAEIRFSNAIGLTMTLDSIPGPV